MKVQFVNWGNTFEIEFYSSTSAYIRCQDFIYRNISHTIKVAVDKESGEWKKSRHHGLYWCVRTIKQYEEATEKAREAATNAILGALRDFERRYPLLMKYFNLQNIRNCILHSNLDIERSQEKIADEQKIIENARSAINLLSQRAVECKAELETVRELLEKEAFELDLRDNNSVNLDKE